jgi:hypothetical protein
MVPMSLSQPENIIDVYPQNNTENFSCSSGNQCFYPPRWAWTFYL